MGSFWWVQNGILGRFVGIHWAYYLCMLCPSENRVAELDGPDSGSEEEDEEELINDLKLQKEAAASGGDSSPIKRPKEEETPDDVKEPGFWSGVLESALDLFPSLKSREGRAGVVHNYMRGLGLPKQGLYLCLLGVWAFSKKKHAVLFFNSFKSTLTLSLLRVIIVKFPLQPDKKKYITQYEELGFSYRLLWCKMIILPILTILRLYISF